PLPAWLEPIDQRHPNTVALVRGPLVLMAVKPEIDAPAPVLTRAALLSATRTGAMEWRAQAANGPIILVAFTELGDRPYATYFDLA
ncbi:MAG: hypothetical protein ABIW18_00120, partial [Sphingomicrobium sp.]